ncbi:MAG: hypothetical protein PHI37_00905 [Candidatus Gracilibacteria bacterium]|nr:hypothetical protein [Candidatus Gracilibacteria bacterium]
MDKINNPLNARTYEPNPLNGIQDKFKERTFCIVGDEMKAKMEALGLKENDILEISRENENHEILKLIDTYFSQIQELKELIKSKYLEEYGEYRGNTSDMSIEEFDNMINEETKNNLKNKLSWGRLLDIFFSKYPGRIKEILKKSYFSNFMYLLEHSSSGEKYQFDFDLAIEFLELAEKIERERTQYQYRFNVFDGICNAYKNLYQKIKNPELFNDLLKLCIANKTRNITFLLAHLKTLSNTDIEKISKNYDLFIRFGILAGKNNTHFPNAFSRKFQLPDNENKRNLIIAGWEKLGEDFFYVYDNSIIFNFAEKYPDKFLNFCENIKKLADITRKNEIFYIMCLEEIIDFTIAYPNSWDFLIRSGKILGKHSLYVMGTGIRFLEVLYTKHQNNFEEILQKTFKLQKKVKYGSNALFMSSGLDFLAEYLEKDGEEKFFEMAKKMVELSNKYLNNENNGVFYSQKENLLTYGLGFIQTYLEYFPEKYEEVLERVMKLINTSSITRIMMWERYFLGFYTFIKEGFIKGNPKILDSLLDFYEKIKQNEDENDLIFKLIDTDFSKKNKKIISKTLVWLLQNNQSQIIPLIKMLFIINDLNLKISLDEILVGEINDGKIENLKKEIKSKLKRKIFFQDNKKKAGYSEIVQEVFGERIDEKLQGFEKIPESERNRNIARVNDKQKQDLKPYGIDISKYDENHRTLVLYFRNENMNSFAFSLITNILQKYITEGYSKVFDKILITSRRDGQYPQEIHNIGGIQYQYHDFINFSTIFANTIHFTHGTVIEEGFEFMSTTTPIVGIANLADKEDKTRVPESGDYTPLYLKYGKTLGYYTAEHFEKDKSGNFEDLFDEIIRAVKSCEEKMLENERVKVIKVNYNMGKEIGRSATGGIVFEIEGNNQLACKISPNLSYEEIEEEFKVGRLLALNGIFTPEYIGISEFNYNGEKCYGIIMSNIKNGILIKDNIPIGGIGATIRNTTSKEYIRGKELLEEEIKKINSINLPIQHIGNWGFDWQGLYVPDEDKIYLIDFGNIRII